MSNSPLHCWQCHCIGADAIVNAPETSGGASISALQPRRQRHQSAKAPGDCVSERPQAREDGYSSTKCSVTVNALLEITIAKGYYHRYQAMRGWMEYYELPDGENGIGMF